MRAGVEERSIGSGLSVAEVTNVNRAAGISAPTST
jgi:hypothetical protein